MAMVLVRIERVAPTIVLWATGAFVVLTLLAMSVYPGGTAWDPTTHGHQFWANYLCDLERETGLDGRSNAFGAALGRAAMAVLALGAAALWVVLPSFLQRSRGLGRTARALGLLSAAGIIGVAAFPSDRFPDLHPLLMLGAGGPGILAAGLFAAGLLAQRALGLAALGGAATLVSMLDLALYVRQIVESSPAPVEVALLERVALLMAIAWQLVVGWTALRTR
jgi:hypothetical protein